MRASLEKIKSSGLFQDNFFCHRFILVLVSMAALLILTSYGAEAQTSGRNCLF